MSVRLATGIRRVIPGNSTDPLGKGRIGRVWDLLWPIFHTHGWRAENVAVSFKAEAGNVSGKLGERKSERWGKLIRLVCCVVE